MNALVQTINDFKLPDGKFALWWIGQNGFVLKTAWGICYFDPYLSDCAERITKGQANEHVRIKPAPMKPEEVTHADWVFCTHDHADHIDPDGIPLIAKASPQAQFVVPECARETMLNFGIDEDRIHCLCGDDCLSFLNFDIHAIPAAHEAFDEDPEKGFPYQSFILHFDDHVLLHAGDTIPYPGQAQKVFEHKVQIALLPINGRDDFRKSLDFEGNFTCEEAVGFALAIQADLCIPMHYDTFTLNTADVRDFERIATHRGLQHHIMEHGGMLLYPREES